MYTFQEIVDKLKGTASTPLSVNASSGNCAWCGKSGATINHSGESTHDGDCDKEYKNSRGIS